MTGQRRRREFPEAFKREAVERVRTSGMTIIAVANELGLHETPQTAVDPEVRRTGAGARAAILDGGLVGPLVGGPRRRTSSADLAAENARLRRENARLSTERDILRKAALAIVLGPTADDGSLFGGATR